MSHDTSKDPRILVAQRACALLQQTLQQKTHVKLATGKEQLASMASAVESTVMALRYSYQSPAEVASSEMAGQLTVTAGSIADALAPVFASSAPSPLLQANLRWCLRILRGLPARLGNSGATLASGVDMVAVKVGNVAKAGTLWLTRVTEGEVEHPVVTNIPGVHAGEVRAVAFLPPREIGGAVSEAMYLGDDPRSEAPGTILEETQVDAREAVSILHDELGKH